MVSSRTKEGVVAHKIVSAEDKAEDKQVQIWGPDSFLKEEQERLAHTQGTTQ